MFTILKLTELFSYMVFVLIQTTFEMNAKINIINEASKAL